MKLAGCAAWRVAGLLALTFVATAPLPVAARMQRYLVAVGVNQGLPDETPLKYAASDARELASILRSPEFFGRDNVFLLEDANLEAVRGLLTKVSQLVRKSEAAGNETLFLFYYSGHGSADALHVRRERLDREEILQRVQDVGADVKVAVLDACESGDFLRQKGLRPAADAPPRKMEAVKTRGAIVLSSSARGELAQESEEYRGSIFSYHFRNGLRGPADRDGDGRIFVLEAFEYARAATRMETVLGRAESQNPGFDLDLVGEGDVELTSMPSSQSRIDLKGLPSGPVEIYDARTFALAHKVWAPGGQDVSYRLPAGSYVVSYRDERGVAVARADIAWKSTRVLESRDFRRESRQALQAKGGARSYLNPNAFEAGFLAGGFASVTGLPALEVSYVRRVPGALQAVTVAWGYPRLTSSGPEATVHSRFLQLGATYKIPVTGFGPMRLLVGAGGALRRSWQEVEDRRLDGQETTPGDFGLPARKEYASTLAGLTLPVEIEDYLPYGMRLSLGVQGGTWLYRAAGSGSWSSRLEWNPRIALAHRF